MQILDLLPLWQAQECKITCLSKNRCSLPFLLHPSLKVSGSFDSNAEACQTVAERFQQEEEEELQLTSGV